MSQPDITIDESTHQRIPTFTERLTNAVISSFLGFILIQIIGFWMFPGLGFGAIYMISHPAFSTAGDVINIYVIAFLAICALLGWFKGEYFLKRLKDYIMFWKFW